MKTKEQLRQEIRELMFALVRNGVNLRMMCRMQNTREQLNLMAARTELLKSICHRQGLLIVALDTEVEYDMKEAA